ncbi:MAG: hypothetical protein HOL80_03185 [Candidatus Magasanikbacteria bacterium]|nr:hypothetical protein [Candidatus Magasanikbacteria bacterium]MBT5262874.1 hypothetical protein [Candidatus Magasanikbacteria bacterium]MBT5820045.1 hypothetical protein [Candidatus Magasanikbacteria bacterium]MBT6294673.1 hypothetical protein [Candidatus Magasanikbacteria bacterium]
MAETHTPEPQLFSACHPNSVIVKKSNTLVRTPKYSFDITFVPPQTILLPDKVTPSHIEKFIRMQQLVDFEGYRYTIIKNFYRVPPKKLGKIIHADVIVCKSPTETNTFYVDIVYVTSKNRPLERLSIVGHKEVRECSFFLEEKQHYLSFFSPLKNKTPRP